MRMSFIGCWLVVSPPCKFLMPAEHKPCAGMKITFCFSWATQPQDELCAEKDQTRRNTCIATRLNPNLQVRQVWALGVFMGDGRE